MRFPFIKGRRAETRTAGGGTGEGGTGIISAPAVPPDAAPALVPATRAPGPMRIVAITRALDEADIVEAFVRHTAAHVTHHLVADNGSRDGTLAILESLAGEGLPLSVYATSSVSFSEATTNTFLYKEAWSRFGADWVIALDCDEFIDDREAKGGIAAALGAVLRDDPGLPVLDLPLIEYEACADDDAGEAIVPLRLRRRATEPVTSKVCVRGGIGLPGVIVDGGNHAVLVDDRPLPSRRATSLRLAHYPRRSRWQMMSKIAKGYAKVIAAGPSQVAKNTSLHYRDLYALLGRSPRDFLAHPHVVRPAGLEEGMVLDPIRYRGGALRHGAPDEFDRSLLTLLGYVDDLAAQHGRLMDELPEVRARVEGWNGDMRRLF